MPKSGRYDRTTGQTHWCRKRTGAKIDDWKIVRLKESVAEVDLETVVSMSGFETLEKWADAVAEFHDGFDGCGFSVIRNKYIVDAFGEMM